ncbi:penicillin-binding protein 1A [Massilia terrae]|uniref:Penicillin-binding protein 1A n=1 Tax=Massilia terrae TaxID=1811224 RepID=A0ABT2CUD3_9BURK|nr:penicillin-binding protein 1A [Massilia terrae]MCS0657586.1 penicillin-binding protein 1A [Massilia terrae]
MRKSTELPRQRSGRERGFILLALAALLLIIAGVGAWFTFTVMRNVPSIEAVTDYRPKIPLRIYTADHVLIGEFGEEHRDFVPIAKIPDMMKKSVLAIEDTRFYEHSGVDWWRALGAARSNVVHGFGSSGGSTITMQVARNFFLSRDKVPSRKLTEVLLAYKIENALTKDQILELYMNQIYLGQRSFGFSSAARTYFGKTLDQLSIAETAMLAGLPQNPSRHNPAVNPKRARQRQHAVLGRMRELNFITQEQYEHAMHEPLRVNTRGQEYDVHAEYVAELARQQVYNEFKEEAYTRGITVTTTILKADQQAAYESLRRNVLAYDQRHGYRGPEARIELPENAEEREDAIVEAIQKRLQSDGLIPVVVLSAAPKKVQVENVDGDVIDITGDGLKLVTNALKESAKDTIKLTPGAVIRIYREGAKGNWTITQVPQVSAAFVAMDADTGAYRAMVGGFDFGLQKFNHVTQAWRQPGSGIKPFIYSAALDKGYSPATRILDAPLEMPGEDAGKTWAPQNDDGKWDGPITMRTALAQSKNVASVRLLRAETVPYAHEYLGKFGFDLDRQPKNYTLALGTGAVTPQQMVGAYAVFANGGYKVQPYLISKIQDGTGKVIAETKTPEVRVEENRVLDPRNVYVMDTMLRDVARYGTGAEATKRLGRTDIAGKTGTTSDAMDGWFSGYGGGVVAVAWMGYDEPRSLGGKEFGATVALPLWIDYMHVALAKAPPQELAVPDGVVRENDDWVYSEFADTPELKYIDIDPNAPEQAADPTAPATTPQQDGTTLPPPGDHPVAAPPGAPVRPLPPATPAAPVRPITLPPPPGEHPLAAPTVR